MRDENFRKEFIDSRSVGIEKYFGDSINAGVVVKTNTKDVFYVVMPHANAELTPNQLDDMQVAGAGP